MRLRPRDASLTALICAATLGLVSSVKAQTTYTWNLGDGTWDTATASWDQGVWVNATPPNNAVFNSSSTYTVTLPNPVTTLTAGDVNITAGNVMFANPANSTVSSNTFTVANGASAAINGTSFFKSGSTNLTVDGNLTLASTPAGGRLVNLSGSGTLTSNGSIRIGNAATQVFSGNLVDFNAGASQFALINMNGAGTTNVLLRLSGNNTGATGDFLLSSGSGNNNNRIRLESTTAISSGTTIRIEGGTTGCVVELAAGDIMRTANPTANQGGNGGFNITGSGGFAALGADRNVTLVSGGTIQWTTQGFNPSSTGFQMGNANATHTLTLTNNINLGGGAAGTRAFYIGNGSAAIDAAIPGTISDTGATQSTLVINGDVGARVVISGSNMLGGQVTINGSTTAGGPIVRITNSNAFGTAGNVLIQGNASLGALELAGGITMPRTIGFNGRATDFSPGIINASGDNTLTGTINGQTGGTNISIQSDSGTLTLQNGFTYTASGTRKLNLGGAGNGVINGTLTGPNDGATPGSAFLQLVKYGTGTWTLGGAVTLTGTSNTLDVQGGTLLINSTYTANESTLSTSVQNGATLGGTGTTGGTVTVAAGGGLAPGTTTTIGTLTVESNSATTLAAGSTLRANVGNSTTTGGQLRLLGDGNLDLSGLSSANKLNINLTAVEGLQLGTLYTLTIVDVAGNGSIVFPGGGFSPDLFNVTSSIPTQSGFTITNPTTDTLVVSFTPVPEPGSIFGIAVIAGAGGFALRRWRGRKAAYASPPIAA